MLELYANVQNPEIPVSDDFKKKQYKVGDKLVTRYKITKFYANENN